MGVPALLINVAGTPLTFAYTIAVLAVMMVMMDYLKVIEKKLDNKEDKK